MAASTLSRPGTKFGPCKDACGHIDCRSTKRTAKQLCRICKMSIGYDRRYYIDPDATPEFELVHADCIEDEEAARRAAK